VKTRSAALFFATTSLLMGCDLVAGLDQFHPDGSSTAASGGSSAGGAGGAVGGAAPSSSSTGAPKCSDHLLINEVQIQEDYVELFNPTATTIDLSTYTLFAASSSSPQTLIEKWDGAAESSFVASKKRFLLAFDLSAYPQANSALFDQLSNQADPTVIVLYDGSTIVDTLCVCSQATTCDFVTDGEELCKGRGLVSFSFHDGGNQASASRQGCVDTDDDGADFAVTCPTPGAPNSANTTCQ
jgi:hypothetical protein